MILGQQSVQQFIKQKKEAAKLRSKKFSLGKIPAQKHPINIERKYFKEFSRIISWLKSANSEMKPKFALILEMANDKRPSLDSNSIKRKDGYSDEIQSVIDAYSAKFGIEFGDILLGEFARIVARGVNDFNAKQFDKMLNKVLGVDPFISEPWLQEEIEAFIVQNVSLIKTIPEDFFKSIKGIVLDGARSGKTINDISSDLDKRVDVSKSKAKFIARDQVSKFNGDLNRLRQTNIGIKSYIWSTSLDERVRESHAKKEGKEFRWDNPPSDTGHPGEDFQCRCVALAIFKEED